MRAFNSSTLALLASGRAASRGLVLFDFPSGLYGFWDGIGSLTVSGVTYAGSGGLIRGDALSLAGSLASATMTLTLSSMPDTVLSPGVLATIESEQYHQRPVTLSRAYFDPATRALLSVERVLRGYVDQMRHAEKPGGEATLSCLIETRARDVTRRGYRVRSDADQKQLASADGSLRHAATAPNDDFYWGRLPGQVKK